MPRPTQPWSPHPEDVDDSFAITDLVRSAEASRLRRRGAMRIHDPTHRRQIQEGQYGEDDEDDEEYDHEYEMPALQEVSDSELSSSSSSSSWIHSLTRTSTARRTHVRRTYELNCGVTHYAFVVPRDTYKPRPIPHPITTSATKPPPPPLRVSNGCGSTFGSAFHHLNAYYISSSGHTGDNHHNNNDNLANTTVPVDLSYVDASLLGLEEPLACRYLRGECGCFRTGLACASCGNVVGIMYRPCSAARSHLGLGAHRKSSMFRVFFPENVTSSSASPTNSTSSSSAGISEWFTYHFPLHGNEDEDEPQPQPFAVPRPLTPPRPRPVDDDNEDEVVRPRVGDGRVHDYDWGVGVAGAAPQFRSTEHAHPHFSLVDVNPPMPRVAREQPENNEASNATATSPEPMGGRRIRGRRPPVRRDALLSPSNLENEPFDQDWFGDGRRLLISPSPNAVEHRGPEHEAGTIPHTNTGATTPMSDPVTTVEIDLSDTETEGATRTATPIESMASFWRHLQNTGHRRRASAPASAAATEAALLSLVNPLDGEAGANRVHPSVIEPFELPDISTSDFGVRITTRWGGNAPMARNRSQGRGQAQRRESSGPRGIHLQVGTREAEEVGYDVGEQVLVDGRLVVVDPYGLFLERGSVADSGRGNGYDDDGMKNEDYLGLGALRRVILSTC